MFEELEKINKVNLVISKQCSKGRLYNVKNVVNLEQRLETSMCLDLTFHPWLARCHFHTHPWQLKHTLFFHLSCSCWNFKFPCITHYSQKLHHIELWQVGLWTWSQYYTPIATELQSQVRNFHSYLFEILCLLPSSTIYDPISSKQPLIQNTPSMITAAQCLKLTLYYTSCSLRLVIFTFALKTWFGIR